MNEENTSSNIADKELDARREALAQMLKIHGFEITRKEEKLIIKHPSGYTKEAYFNKARITDSFTRTGSEAITTHLSDRASQSSDKEMKELYVKAGKEALQSERADFVHSYFQSIQAELKKELRLKQLKKAQQPSKGSPSPSK